MEAVIIIIPELVWMCQGVQILISWVYNMFIFTILNVSLSQLKYVTYIQNQA